MPDDTLQPATAGGRGLSWLVAQLDARESVVDEKTARQLLIESRVSRGEIAKYVEPREGAYARRTVARRELYELLVLTWIPGQGSVAHDHCGSLCGLKVIQGKLVEQLFQCGPDGQVRPASQSSLATGEITVDPGVVVHSLANSEDSTEVLVTLHIYSPPLPEVRRYAVASSPPAEVFTNAKPSNAPVVAIIGGGFTGAMTAAHLLRECGKANTPLRIVLIDRQPAVGEGIAYRTNDPCHLLNVPVEKMSAWPDQPGDFLEFARAADPSVKPGDFLPRRIYGRYVRQILLGLAQSASSNVSVEMLRDDATSLASAGDSTGWTVSTAGGKSIRADVAIITLGHRPPAEGFSRCWKGPRTRYVADPWAALVLSQIGPDEPVVVLGTGLTAVDAVLTLDRADRTAPLMLVSRRGLMPQPHAREPRAPEDVSALVAKWLDASGPLKIAALTRALREHAASAARKGIDWRQVIDGLRPFTARIWERLGPEERARFLRHVRPFWEIHRHRMAPAIAERLTQLRARKILHVVAGALVSAEAGMEGVDITLNCRGSGEARRLRAAWVINCTGPGVHYRDSTHPILRPLIEAGELCDDALGLGLRTDADGRAVNASGEAHENLLVAGTLRKSTLWESTAVPELRQQAAAAARVALEKLRKI